MKSAFPLKIVAIFCSLTALNSCGPRRIRPNTALLTQPNVTVGIVFGKQPEPAAYKIGPQGLVDMGINYLMDSRLRKRLKQIDLIGFTQIGESFASEFAKRNVTTKLLGLPFDLDAYPKNKSQAKDALEKDLSELKKKENVDFLIILVVEAWGTIRDYYGFAPLGSPNGYFYVSGTLADLESGLLLWQTKYPIARARVEVEGDWDQPPDYPNLLVAVDRAIAKGKNFLVRDFFSAWPPPVAP